MGIARSSFYALPVGMVDDEGIVAEIRATSDAGQVRDVLETRSMSGARLGAGEVVSDAL